VSALARQLFEQLPVVPEFEGNETMLDVLKAHWPEYLIEAAGLIGFMLGAGLLALTLEHPDSPIHQVFGEQALLRRVPLGLLMGTYIAAFIYSPWGQRSGAHINPAVTWSFYRLGKIRLWDAAFYTLAQFAGAILIAQLLKLALGEPFAHPAVNYAATAPKPGVHDTLDAFVAEFIISFIMMLVALAATNSQRFEKYTGFFIGLLLAIYLIVETPYSGMSLNPARSFGSALAARHWMDLWVYFTAPPLAMLLATEMFRYLKKGQLSSCAKLRHRADRSCIFCDHKEGPDYPVAEEAAA